MTFLSSRSRVKLYFYTIITLIVTALVVGFIMTHEDDSIKRAGSPKFSAMMVDEPVAHPTIPLPDRTEPAPPPKPKPTATPTPRPKPVTRSYQRPPGWVQSFLQCVISHESRHAGMYTAENPYSTASGAYQFIDSSWQAYSRMAGHAGWSHAAYAPPEVQDAVAAWVVIHQGTYPWKGTHCGYGT